MKEHEYIQMKNTIEAYQDAFTWLEQQEWFQKNRGELTHRIESIIEQ